MNIFCKIIAFYTIVYVQKLFSAKNHLEIMMVFLLIETPKSSPLLEELFVYY